MKDNNRVLSFVVTLTVPYVATVYQVRDYIVDAVSSWGGGYDKHHPLFSGRVRNVKVKRLGDSGKREPLGADPINLTALITRLHVVESQIRRAGGIPKDKPIKVPVKVCEGFGAFRYGIAHITAKPGNMVLLHFDKED